MYNRDGKEDVEFRLLHVYYSIKRANSSISAKAKISSKASKVKKKKNLPHKSMSTAVRKATIKKNRPGSKPTRRAVLPSQCIVLSQEMIYLSTPDQLVCESEFIVSH